MGIKELLLNKEESRIKAIVYVDKQNNVRTAYDNFNEVETKYKKENTVKIFKYKKADLNWLESILSEKARISGEKTFGVEFDPSELYEMILKFTDLDLGFDKENSDDMKQWKEILEEKSDLIMSIQREVTAIITMVVKLMVAGFEEIMDMPDSMKEAMILNFENKKVEKDIEKLKKQVKPKEKAKPNRVKNKQNKDFEIAELAESEVIDVVEVKNE